MAPRQFADLHCHNTFYAFNRMRNSDMEANPEVFHPWTVLPSNLKAMARGGNANTYCQSNVAQCTAGRLRLAFLSITPVERGFFEWNLDDHTGTFPAEVGRWLSGITPLKIGANLLRARALDALDEAARVLRKGPLRELVTQGYLRFGRKRLGFLLSDRYDYWDEFLREIDFLERKNGQISGATLEHNSPTGPVKQDVTGRYHLVNDVERFDQILTDPHSDDVLTVLTIEGAHVFTLDHKDERVSDALIFERIEAMKALPYPIFFITIAHHFDNGICGHAPSIPKIFTPLINQSSRLSEPFEEERDLGRRVVRELLDLDEELSDRGGKRILVDVKHMSARTRQQYYAEVVEPYNAAWADRSAEEQARFPKLPVIGSHICYSGVSTLDELIANTDNETDHWHVGPYSAWSINFSDEDVRAVHASEGLMGICFDQRIAGITLRQRVPYSHWGHVLANQIFGLVDVIMNDDRLAPEDKITIWDRVMMGTDYDGVINPMTKYPTALELGEAFEDLERIFHKVRHTRMIDQIGVDELLEKIAWKNAHAFVCKHMPAALGQGVDVEAAAE